MPEGVVPSWLKSILRRPQATTTLTTNEAVATPAEPPPTPPLPPPPPAAEPTSLATRIQSLIGRLPSTASSPSVSTSSISAQASDTSYARDDLQPSSSISDSDLEHVLSSPVMMNGELDGQPSIWNILDGMLSTRNTTSSTNTSVVPAIPDSPRPNLPADTTIADTYTDSSSVMVYSPLFPQAGSLVELAESEEIVVEDVDSDDDDLPIAQPSSPPAATAVAPPPIQGWSWANTLPSVVSSWFTQSSNPSPPPPPPPTMPGGFEEVMTPRMRERRRLRAQRAWVPAKDKLSIQCMWWGYRMYLPPPILDVLDDRQLEAARRAAMITTALTWFFNNLPIMTFPLPLRPPLMLLQQISPFLGSIGTFISWSWTVIKGYDQGYGVTLTATWLLPIALIPGTWWESEWPVSPPPEAFSPLPLPSIEATLESGSGTVTTSMTTMTTTTAMSGSTTPTATVTTVSPDATPVVHSNFFPTPEATPTQGNLYLLPPMSPQMTPRAFTSSPIPPNTHSPQMILHPLPQSSPSTSPRHLPQSPLPQSSPQYSPGMTLPPHSPPIPSPLPMSPLNLPHSPPMVPMPLSPQPYNSNGAYIYSPGPQGTVSSPETSFATAPNSPVPHAVPSSPSSKKFKRTSLSLAGLVARSPIIRASGSSSSSGSKEKEKGKGLGKSKSKHKHSSSGSSNSSSVASPQLSSSGRLPQSNISSSPSTPYSPYTQYTSVPFSPSPLAQSTPLPAIQYQSLPGAVNGMSDEEEMAVIFPYQHWRQSLHFANGNGGGGGVQQDELRLLQSPVWQCSPLPVESQPLHSDECLIDAYHYSP